MGAPVGEMLDAAESSIETPSFDGGVVGTEIVAGVAIEERARVARRGRSVDVEEIDDGLDQRVLAGHAANRSEIPERVGCVIEHAVEQDNVVRAVDRVR